MVEFGPVFEAALQELLEKTGGELAIFCDYEGEAIALASRGLDPFEVRVLGAHQAAVVLQLQRIARESGLGERLSLTAVAEKRTLILEALPGGYYVLLVPAPAGAVAVAQRALREVAARFQREL